MNKLFVLMLLTSFFVYGCVPTEKPMLLEDDGVNWSKYSSVELEPIINETGSKFEVDVLGKLSSMISVKLAEKGYQTSGGSSKSEDVLVLTCKLISYAPGNAFQRWAVPGAGTSQATVMTKLSDKATGHVNAEMVSSKSISSGLFGGIGGDIKILEIIADDIANKIGERLKR